MRLNALAVTFVVLSLLLSPGTVAAAPPGPGAAPAQSADPGAAPPAPPDAERLAGIAGGAGTAHAAEATTLDFARFFLLPDPINAPQTETAAAIDSRGGIHAAFSAETSNTEGRPAYYAYCAANCRNGANWTIVPVGDLGLFGEHATLALDPQGRPRMMWFVQNSITGSGQYRYAECDAGCTQKSNWKVSPGLATTVFTPADVHYFTLDPQGRPRFIYNGDGPRYVVCDSGCTLLSGWHDYASDLPQYIWSGRPYLAFTPSGQPRVLGSAEGPNYQSFLWYSWCDAGCNNMDNWFGTWVAGAPESGTSWQIGVYSGWSLRINSKGKPRIALYPGYMAEKLDQEQLYYAWNDGDPKVAANWKRAPVGMEHDFGRNVEMVLDAQDRPHVAFHIDYVDSEQPSVDGIGYARCTANCDSASAAWEPQLVETAESLNASDPIEINSTKGCTVSTWTEVGYEPALALDAAGNPSAVYFVNHYQTALYQQSPCYLWNDFKAIRAAVVGSVPATPTAPRSVTLAGPITGVTGAARTFTATAGPAGVTLPLTYEWSATGQAVVTHANRGTLDSVSFTWPAGAVGVKTVTVRVRNSVGGPVVATREILITSLPVVFDSRVHLPLGFKRK